MGWEVDMAIHPVQTPGHGEEGHIHDPGADTGAGGITSGPVFQGGFGGASGVGSPSGVGEFFLGTGDTTPFIPPTAIRTISDPQDVSLQNLLNFLMQSLGGFDPGIAAFNTELPGPTDLTSASLTGLERIAAGESGVFGDPATNQGLEALRGILGRGPEDFSEFFETGVAEPAQRDLQRALEEVSAAAVGSGNLFGSARQEGEARATEEFFRNLSGERARFGLATLNQSTQDILAAAGLIPGLANVGFERGERLFDIGERAREPGVQQFEADRAEQERQDAIRNFILELMFRSSVAPTFSAVGGFPLQTEKGGGGFLGGLFGG